MEAYRNNSNKSKEEASRKPEKVISGEAKKKKKTEVRKFAESFIQGDVKEIKTYLIFDVLIPYLKKGVLDMLNKGASMLLLGNASGAKSISDIKASKVAYSKMYDEREPRPWSARTRRYDYDDLVYESNEDAVSVLNAMADILDRYKIVKVADLYDLSNVTPSQTDYNYGWTDLRTASVSQISNGGFVINLPRPMPID